MSYKFLVALTLTSSFLSMVGERAYAAETVCQRRDILFCEDWETYGLGAPIGWEIDAERFLPDEGRVVDRPALFGSKRALELRISHETANPISLRRLFKSKQGPISLRWYARWSEGSVRDSGGTEVMDMESIDSSGRAIWLAQLTLQETDGTPEVGRPVIQLGCGTVDHSAGQCADSALRLEQNVGDPVDIFPGRWYEFEMGIRPDLIGVPFSGEIKLWINGKLKVYYSGDRLRKPMEIPPIHGMKISPRCARPCGSTPRDRKVWYDNIVAAIEYIGPADVSPPSAPTNLTVK